jgi:hypothetical protein
MLVHLDAGVVRRLVPVRYLQEGELYSDETEPLYQVWKVRKAPTLRAGRVHFCADRVGRRGGNGAGAFVGCELDPWRTVWVLEEVPADFA